MNRPDSEAPALESEGDAAEPGHPGAKSADPESRDPLLDELLEKSRSFTFFQAVRLLERLFPDREGIGRFVDPAREVARFSVEPFLSFPATQIEKLELEDGGPARIAVNFMGLTGPLGVLPHYYTLLVAERVRARDRALKDFLDIFHHRIVSLFYRAWEKQQFTVAHERDGRDRVTEHLLDLIGLGLPVHRGRMAVTDEALVFYSGLLAPHQRSAIALEQLLEDYFDVPVEVEQFVGGWYPLSVQSQCSLGDGASPSAQLGKGAVAGDEIWDQQSRVRIRIGPLSRERYDEFLPTGSAHEPLRTLVRFFSNDQFDFELQLVLARDEVPGCVVGADEEAAAPLGWSTWVRSAPFDRDADEAILRL